MVPDPDDGVSQVKATFVARIRKAGDWMAGASLDKCTIAGTNGLGLSVTDMYYDHSDIQNPPGMVFPKDYKDTTKTWHGFYIKSATLTLPKDVQTFKNSPPQLSVNNFIIDGTGFSFDFLATNILKIDEANFAGWGGSIDTIDIKFVSNSLQSGLMNGLIHIPISSGTLKYAAIFSRPKAGTWNLTLNVQPRDSLQADLWAATLTLDKSSIISVWDSNGNPGALANFDGHLTISGDVGNTLSKIPGINFKGVKFQGVKIMSKSPWVDKGTWSLASEQHSMAGFPVSLSNISPVVDMQMSKVRLGVEFTLSINLHGDDTANGIAGSTTLDIWGAMPLGGGGPQQFSFDEIDLKSITVHAQMSGLTIDGSLILYHHDATFGDGFRGALMVDFASVMTGKATAQFGSVNGYRYWYVDAMVTLATGVPLGSSGVGLYGFGGGAWYHMARSNPTVDLHGPPNSGDPKSAPADSGSTPGGTNSGVTYTPDVGVDLGLKAGVTLGTYPSPSMFNADVSLTIQFVNGGVGLMAFDGNGYFVCPDLDHRKDALVFLVASIQYDFINKSFDANFSFNTNNSYAALFSATGWMAFHADPQNWHLLIGTPDNRNKVTLLTLATVDSYLMAGTDIPAPDFDNFEHKSDIELAIGGPLPSVHAPISKGPTEGLAFGASASVNTGRVTFLIFFGQFDLGFGFDIAFTHDVTRKCDNTGSVPGIDGWYAVGQLYAYIEFQIGLHVDVWFTEGDFTILDMGAGARCIVMAPNPIWVQGTVGGHYDILGGLVSGQCSFTFEIGDKCVVSVENPLAAIDLITDMQPANGSSNVDVFTVSKAAFNLAIGQSVDIAYVDGDGNNVSKTFRAMLQSFTVARTDNGQPVAGHYELAPDALSAGFLAQDALEQYTQYTVTVTVYAQEWNGSGWVQTYKKNNDPVTQTKSVTFTSGKRPDVILAQNVMSSYPLNRQKFFLQDESHTGALAARASGYLFQEPGTYIARFVPLGAADTTDSPASYNDYQQSVYFNIPMLKNSMVYALQIIRKDPLALYTHVQLNSVMFAATNTTTSVNNYLTTRAYTSSGNFSALASTAIVQNRVLPGTVVKSNEKLLYVYYFQTSQFNSLASKFASVTFKSLDHNVYWSIFESNLAHFNTAEPFDDYDVNGYDVFDGFSTNHQDGLVHVDAHIPSEYWYSSFVWPNIYSHVEMLIAYHMWDAPELDHFVIGLFNPDQTASFVASASGKLSVPSVDNQNTGSRSIMRSAFMLSSRSSSSAASQGMLIPLGGVLGNFSPEFRVKYYHGDEIGSDYVNLWWKCHAIMMEYYNGGYDDPDSWLYGFKDWVDNNSWWINYYNSLDISHMNDGYQLMKSDYYTIDFIYSPKFTWFESGPWIKKQFTLGTPPKQLIRTGVMRFH